ncbi:signal peptidase II [Pedobacter steynii]|uniref:Lipoprotein signal peptidase n=1 Tax=Pedobacter steynii TaxID=430522 RepID=A0A1H0B451_9SPHI|nr:signal peptidase II [Pedobacter steynii]SDN40397.1 signal peptidase II [Pedobacter steynii]
MKKMKWSGLAGKVLILVIVMFNIGCDQITKSIVREHVQSNANIKIISDKITLTNVENSGAFLSVGDSLHSGIKFVLLLLLPLAVLLMGVYFVMTRKNLSPLLTFGICCVIGGGAGNLYDRIIYGSVTDFLHIDFVVFQTGVFNAADLSIMLGMLLIMIDSFSRRKLANASYS